MDYDDTIHLRQLCKKYDDNSELLNGCLKLAADHELTLDMGIVEENVSDRLSWKNKVLELIKTNSSYSSVYTGYVKAKTQIKVCQTSLKSIETEINCIKKTLEVIPK